MTNKSTTEQESFRQFCRAGALQVAALHRLQHVRVIAQGVLRPRDHLGLIDNVSLGVLRPRDHLGLIDNVSLG